MPIWSASSGGWTGNERGGIEKHYKAGRLLYIGAEMRVPRIIRRFIEPDEEVDVEIEEETVEDDELWDIGREIEERNVEVEAEETTYSGVLMSEAGETEGPDIEKKEYTLPQFYLSHEEKKAAEGDAFGDSGERVVEKNWEKTAPESLDEIERHVDEGMLEHEKQPVEEPAGEEPIQGERPEDITGAVIDRDIVYETDGGYVLKVTSREEGAVQTSYYSVSRVDGIEQALDKIQDYQPTVRQSPPPAPRQVRQPERKQKGGEKKSFLGSMLGKE